MAKYNTDTLLSKIKAKHSEAFANVHDAGVVKRFQLESPQLNFVFGGGFPMGRVIELFGPESSGKSSISTYIAMQNQLHNTERPIVVYMDYERTFDVTHAEELGLDVADDKFILLQPLSGEEGFQIMKELIEAIPVGVVIWDSIGATASASQMEDAFKASFGGTASVLSSGLKMINPYLAKYYTSLIFVNQERALIGGFSPVPGATSTPGGFARKFYASSRNRITRIETLKEGGEPVGIKMKFRNVKSKVGVPFREAIINLYFASGIDSEGEYIDFILKLLCERKGAWYNNEAWGMHAQGSNGVVEFLEANPEIYKKAKQDVNDMLCGRTILDNDKSDISEDALEEMTPEEKAWADYKKEDDDDFIEV